MKRHIWNIRVRLSDWLRMLYRKVRPAKKQYILEIQDSELKIGDDNG